MAMDAFNEALRIHHGADIDVPGRRACKEKKRDVVKELLALAFSRSSYRRYVLYLARLKNPS
jgi:hypothetical protein